MIVRRGTLHGALYVLAALTFFVTLGLAALTGKIDLQFYADSLTYHEAARQLQVSLSLIQLTSNLLGPVLILRMLGSSMVAVFWFNVALYAISLRLVMRTFDVRSGLLVLLLAMSPMLFSSMQSINKEIVSLLVIVLAACYLKGGRVAYALLSLAIAVLVRWQLVAVLIVAYTVLSPVNPFRRRRVLTLLLLVLGLSIVYPMQLETLANVNRVAQLGEINNSGVTGIYSQLIWIQNRPLGYLAVVLPKTLHLWGGLAFRWQKLLDWSEFYNNVVVVSQVISNVVMLALVLLRRRFRLGNDLVFLACVFAAIFALSPIYQPRYLFPIYVLFAIVVAERTAGRPVAPARVTDGQA